MAEAVRAQGSHSTASEFARDDGTLDREYRPHLKELNEWRRAGQAKGGVPSVCHSNDQENNGPLQVGGDLHVASGADPHLQGGHSRDRLLLPDAGEPVQFGVLFSCAVRFACGWGGQGAECVLGALSCLGVSDHACVNGLPAQVY